MIRGVNGQISRIGPNSGRKQEPPALWQSDHFHHAAIAGIAAQVSRLAMLLSLHFARGKRVAAFSSKLNAHIEEVHRKIDANATTALNPDYSSRR